LPVEAPQLRDHVRQLQFDSPLWFIVAYNTQITGRLCSVPFWCACFITSSLLVPMASSESSRCCEDMDAPGSLGMVGRWKDEKCKRQLGVPEG
jgi:hypothetical protein